MSGLKLIVSVSEQMDSLTNDQSCLVEKFDILCLYTLNSIGLKKN